MRTARLDTNNKSNKSQASALLQLLHQIADDIEDTAGNIGTAVDSLSDPIFDICLKFPDWQLDVVNALLTIAVRTAYIPDLIGQVAIARHNQERLEEKLDDICGVLDEIKQTLQFPHLYVHRNGEGRQPSRKQKKRKGGNQNWRPSYEAQSARLQP